MITGENLTLRDYLAIAYTLHTHCIHIDFVNSFSHQIKITLRCIKLMLLHLADFSSPRRHLSSQIVAFGAADKAYKVPMGS